MLIMLMFIMKRPVHTKNDNYNDKNIVVKSFEIYKNSRVHTTTITIMAQKKHIIGIFSS